MHIPKSSLCVCSLGSLSCLLSVRMLLCKRKVPKHEAETGSKPVLNTTYDRIDVTTVGAFIITVLYKRHWRVVCSAYVIAFADRPR